MELQHAIELIRCDHLATEKVTTWTDLGCGSGLFTRALAHFLHPGSVIHAVDTNKRVLSKMELPTNGILIEKVPADFVQDPLSFSGLDGILMANSLHFVQDPKLFLKKAEKWLQPNGCFLLVEYDTDLPNAWVPYPLSFAALQNLLAQLGYRVIEKLRERPSLYHRAPIYAALVKKM